MKILDRYLLKLFVSTFTTVFVILFFIFILQTVWLFISELAGKDLDFVSVVKFLTFATPRVVPLVLPLSVLLASIMTFGNLAENYELAALKSSGVSLKRAMKYLTVFILLMSVLAFIFANNVIPYAEYKFINFRRNIAQVKPAMAIAEGQFSEVGNFIIKVEKKSGDNGRFLDKVTIHKRMSYGNSEATIIKAKKGELISSEDSNVLMMVLKDGYYYEEVRPKKLEDREKIPFAKSKFSRYTINIDLSKFNQDPESNEQVTNTNTMLTVGELSYTLDSLENDFKKDVISFGDNMNSKIIPVQPKVTNVPIPSDIESKEKLQNSNLLSNFTDSERIQILNNALSVNESNNFTIESSKYDFENKTKNINGHWIALYDKFVIAFSCILMFFIGAPLGAIIRKGGLGLPIVFAVLIFIIFHFINTFGKKLAQENGITPFLGCWMSTIVLLPLAIFLTKRATQDRGVSLELVWLDRLLERFKSQSAIIDNSEGKDVEWKLDESLEKDLTTLSTKEPLTPQKVKQYHLLSLLTLLLFGVTIFFGIRENIQTPILPIVLGILSIIASGISQFLLNKKLIKSGIDHDIYWLISALLTIPFFPLILGYNMIVIVKNLKQHHKNE